MNKKFCITATKLDKNGNSYTAFSYYGHEGNALAAYNDGYIDIFEIKYGRAALVHTIRIDDYETINIRNY